MKNSTWESFIEKKSRILIRKITIKTKTLLPLPEKRKVTKIVPFSTADFYFVLINMLTILIKSKNVRNLFQFILRRC